MQMNEITLLFLSFNHFGLTTWSFILLSPQITEEFEEIPVQSRGFGILDVGYKSKVNIINLVAWFGIIRFYLSKS